MIIETDQRDRDGASTFCMIISEKGLTLGADLTLLRMVGNQFAIEQDGERCLALLSILARRAVPPETVLALVAAAGHLRNGDKALANLRLAFARLPLRADAADQERLRAAEFLLDGGFSPHRLLCEIGLRKNDIESFSKYDENQPRVPAGNGRQSGQWGSLSGSGRIVLTGAVAARGFLAGATPDIVAALTRYATRFSIPTAVLGALFIPTPNDGGVTEGTLPDAPDITFRHDGPAGTLVLTTDGVTIVAHQQAGLFVDARTGQEIGRNLGGHLVLALALVTELVTQTKAAEEDEGTKPKAGVDEDEPELCPAAEKDVPHGSWDAAKNYEDDVHFRVNPTDPIPREFGVRFTNPVTGATYAFDDCFRFYGDMVDGDMKPGDMADAKGRGYEFLLTSNKATSAGVMAKLQLQADRQLDTIKGTGRYIKWYFAEKGAADFVAEKIKDPRLIIGHMPPSQFR